MAPYFGQRNGLRTAGANYPLAGNPSECWKRGGMATNILWNLGGARSPDRILSVTPQNASLRSYRNLRPAPRRRTTLIPAEAVLPFFSPSHPSLTSNR